MNEPATKENPLLRWAAILFVASCGLGPMVVFGCSPEWARWDASQANAFFKQGETSNALYQLRDAIRKSPRDPVIKLTLAERLIQLKQSQEALVLCGEVLEKYPDNVHAMQVKAQAQQRAGDFEAALETELGIDQWLSSDPNDPSRRNARAYARVLANQGLSLAKEEIELAISKYNYGLELRWPGDNELTLHFQVKAIVLASLVSRCCELQKESLAVLNEEIAFYRRVSDASRDGLAAILYRKAKDAFPLREDKAIRDQRRALRSTERQLANLLSCRALLWQDLENSERCQSDRREVQAIGYRSSQVISEFPDDKNAILLLRSGIGAYLDTRGFVSGKLPWPDNPPAFNQQRYRSSSHSDALRDMNLAVLCNQVNQASFDCYLTNDYQLSFDHDRELKLLKKHEVVFRYHRMLVHQRAGDQELADVDEQRIQDLGEKPGPGIF